MAALALTPMLPHAAAQAAPHVGGGHIGTGHFATGHIGGGRFHGRFAATRGWDGGWWGGEPGWSDADGYAYDEAYPYYYPSYSAPSIAAAGPYWYYCQNPAGYYPYVQQCSGAWQPVPQG